MNARTGMTGRWLRAGWSWLLAGAACVWAGGGCLEIRDGYFWDPQTAATFIPRGIAYQTWNPPVGADQSFEQLEYDLVEFKTMYANSVRCEMVWNQIEPREGEFDFSKPDYLVRRAEELGLKLFVLIGFQYAPGWFADHGDWQAVNSHGETSVVLNYEHPEVRRAYSNYIAQVTARYRGRPAVGAWILGNEYAYFDLWEEQRSYLGYDAYSIASYRTFLHRQYGGDIDALNATWQSHFTSFDTIPMPTAYPADRNDPTFHDLIQWRKQSIADYVAVGAVSTQLHDPDHLRTYSMIGGLFGEADANYTCEDAKTIVRSCTQAGAPLHFWSINSYAIAAMSIELRSATFAIARHRAASGLPVMVSETGHSSTENLHPGVAGRQPVAVPGQMWEALLSGAIGTHLFTWNDRDMFTGDYFPREKGFGIVHQSRLPKDPVYGNCVEMFRRMEQTQLDRLLAGSTDAPMDIGLFWSESSDLGWPRANHENIHLWSTLKRLGYQPGLIDDGEFEAGRWRQVKALLLSRCFQLDPDHLDTIAGDVIAAGIHVHANADLPGQFNAYHQPNPRWPEFMSTLFGLNVAGARPGWDGYSTDPYGQQRALQLRGAADLGPLLSTDSDVIGTWKIWHGLAAVSGSTIVRHTGLGGSQLPLPALQIKTLKEARTAVNTFALGDTTDLLDNPTHAWDLRYNWLRAIYRDHFGLTPPIELSGAGAQYVFPDYRFCANGSILISLLNGRTNEASVNLVAKALLDGKAIEDLSHGGLLETNSTGGLTLTMKGDQHLVLYAYSRTNGVDASLINANPNKIWVESAPRAVWPNGPGYDITVGYDATEALDLVVSLQSEAPVRRSYAQSGPVRISGKGALTVTLKIPEADPRDLDYVSSRDGGKYRLHARLQQDGLALSEVTLPVRLLWGVRPLQLPSVVQPGAQYDIPVQWEELPSYELAEASTPLDRAARWQQFQASWQHYEIVLELRDAAEQLAASDRYLTRRGSGSHLFSIAVPTGVTGPFTWLAYLRPAPNASHDLFDSFEQRTPASIKDVQKVDPNALSPMSPWMSYHYPSPNGAQQWWDEGVGTNASDGKWSAFLVITNPPPPLGYSGFGLTYPYAQTWSLPSDFMQWTNYNFSCDYLDTFGHAAVLELQVKDDLGGGLRFLQDYAPGSNGWNTISAPLTSFEVMTNSPASGYFNQARVRQLVINVQMQEAGATYAANFDRIHFDGPEQAAPATTSQDVLDGFEDRPHGNQTEFLLPWNPYAYAEFNNASNLACGIWADEASEGFRSAFFVVQNPGNPGAYSGFGLYRDFASAWALPVDPSAWNRFVFSCDFKESRGHDCILELQVKSSADHWLSYFKPHAGSDAWDTIRAPLSDFRLPPGSQGFDPTHVQTLALNIQMQDTDAIYLGSFDNVRFDGPDTPLPPEMRYGTFHGISDFAWDTDSDGIPDAYETGTGIFQSPTDVGTDPQNADTDGDGMTDGQELTTGTDPNSTSEVFRLTTVERLPNGDVRLGWTVTTNRLYTVYSAEELPSTGGVFVPVPNLTDLAPSAAGLMHGVDSSPNTSTQRYYRISVELRSP